MKRAAFYPLRTGNIHRGGILLNRFVSRKNRVKLWLILLAAVPFVQLGGCALFPEEEEPIPVPLVEVKQAEYLTKTPRRETIENRVSGTAEIVPMQSANVSFTDSSGYLAKMYFENGDYVNEGDLLCALESPDIGEQLTEAEMRAEIAELEYQQARQQYRNGAIDEISWKRAELNIYIVRRDLEKLRAKFEATQLYAPMSGQIIYRATVSEGDLVNARDTLYTIADLEKLYVRYSGADYNKLPLYTECELTFTGGTEIYTGTVIQTPDNLPDTALPIDKYSVLLELDRELPEGVALGTQMNLSYLIERSENALVIAKSAIKTAGTLTYVYVLEDGYRRERDILVGITSGYDAEILKGLDEADLVIY